MEERSHCGSGGCMTCPFSFNEEAEQVQNYACLPTNFDIVRMKEQSGHNWECHSEEGKMCGGFAKYVKDNRPDLDIKKGNLIPMDIWYRQGEEKAIHMAGGGNMGIINGSKFTHKKGGKYEFISVVHPASEIPAGFLVDLHGKPVFHTELLKDVLMYTDSANVLASYSEVDEYLVLYRDETGRLFLRPIQMFFEHVQEKNGDWVRRFEEDK